ncbi:MAG: trypsin-like peptidase domain-containing protein [Spirochaetales bacterium]|nr:trypsin-like peptidase domain-containing protein [Spirochaetales bacterium]
MKPMKPFPRFSFPQPPPPEPPPSHWEVIRRWLERFYSRRRVLVLIGAAVLWTAAAVLAYDLLKPEPKQLTQAEVRSTIARTLEEAPPEPSFASLAYQVIRPSVVLVHSPGTETDRERRETGGAVGTGVVIVDSGIILTALHVVMDAETVLVIFADGSESPAAVVARQPENDLAVLQAMVIPDDLVPATMAGSLMLQVGDQVAAVGHPFGISNSLSAGVVSGLERTYVSPDTGLPLSNLIQFDAAVNPGNSGGPLINRDGEVVGIVTALVNPTEQEFFVGIGFAVIIETAGGLAGEPVW